MRNLDMATLMNMLSKVDKKDLEKGIQQANAIMQSKDKDKIIEELKKESKQIKGMFFVKEDMSDMMQKIGAMLNNGNLSDNLKDAMNQFRNSSSSDVDKVADTSSSNSQTQIDPKMLENLLNLFSSQSQGQKDSNSSKETNNPSDSGIDFETIMKMKTVFEKMNQTKKDDPRANLLLSLKPYLKKSRKEKVDQYVKLLNMGKIIEVLKPDGGDQTHDV